MSRASHSPLPWRVDEDDDILDAQDHLVAAVKNVSRSRRQGSRKGNAALIVVASNNHAALVAALEAAEPILRAYIPEDRFDVTCYSLAGRRISRTSW